jgi:hypothetical protein
VVPTWVSWCRARERVRPSSTAACFADDRRPRGCVRSPSSKGQGQLTLNVDKGNRLINFQLTYSNLSSPVTVSHIHFGKRHVAGGVMVFFCSNNANPPPGTQTCPMTGGNVQALAGQNVTAGDFDALLAALESNTAYGNIHTTNFTAGEIRGQILPSKKHD